jgi:hypothetical protein
MIHCAVRIPGRALLTGIVAVFLLAPALLHCCPVGGHADTGGSDTHCLICSVCNHSVLNPDIPDCAALQTVSRLPAPAGPVFNWDLPLRKSLLARAPPFAVAI